MKKCYNEKDHSFKTIVVPFYKEWKNSFGAYKKEVKHYRSISTCEKCGLQAIKTIYE